MNTSLPVYVVVWADNDLGGERLSMFATKCEAIAFSASLSQTLNAPIVFQTTDDGVAEYINAADPITPLVVNDLRWSN
jgi:hypothetical protein